MRVAVTGSSGLIGQALLPALQATGHETVALIRRPPGRGEALWDPATGSIDMTALEGVDGAINLAGENIATRWTDESKRRIRESRIDATTLLATTLAALAPRPKVLISISAVGIYGDRDDDVITEESALGQGFLPDLGREWEASAEPARGAGIRVVHPRLGIVLSRNGGALEKMLLPFKLGVGGRVGSGRQWMSWIALDDVINALLFLLNTGSLHGAVNVTSPEPVRNGEFTDQLGKALHRPTLLPVPKVALQVLYGKEMPETTLLNGARVIPRRLLDTGFKFLFPALGPALRHVLDE